MKTQVKIAEPEILTVPQRLLELFIIAAMLALFGFLVYHQQTNSGFFTEKFGTAEMVYLYGPILLALIAPAIRAQTGHRNPARPFEIATNVFLALGSLGLEIVFPFNFAHLADTLPSGLHFVLAWVTDNLGRILLALQVFFGAFSALVATLRYRSNRQRELTHTY